MAVKITGIIVPADPDSDITQVVFERGDLEYMQRVVGGYVEATDMPRVKATIWSNDEGAIIKLPVNVRASEFLYKFAPEHEGHNIMFGDVLITGLPDKDGDTQSVTAVVQRYLLES